MCWYFCLAYIYCLWTGLGWKLPQCPEEHNVIILYVLSLGLVLGGNCPIRTQYMYCLWDWSWVETAPEEHNICTVFGTGLGWKLPQKNTIYVLSLGLVLGGNCPRILVWKGFNNEAAIFISSFFSLFLSLTPNKTTDLIQKYNIKFALFKAKQKQQQQRTTTTLSTIWI